MTYAEVIKGADAMRFWVMSMSASAWEPILAAQQKDRSAVVTENADALYEWSMDAAEIKTDAEGYTLFHHAPAPVPKGMPRLRVSIPGHAPDFLHEGFFYVSAAWRRAANLPKDVARYYDVDLSEAGAAARAQDYKVMWPLAVRDWIDPARSGVQIDPVAPGSSEIRKSLERPVFRADISPDVDLFLTPHFPFLFVTDALADRLMRAGMQVSFLNYSDPIPENTHPPELAKKPGAIKSRLQLIGAILDRLP